MKNPGFSKGTASYSTSLLSNKTQTHTDLKEFTSISMYIVSKAIIRQSDRRWVRNTLEIF